MKAVQNNQKIKTLLGLVVLLTLCVAMGGTLHAREMIDYPVVKLQSLDKATANTQTFEARVGTTIKYGPLYIRTQACRKAPPIEQPESAAFLQIWEVTPKDKAKWVFSGWMFASSPAVSSMDHPIYDVWVLDCLEDTEKDDGIADDDAADPDGVRTHDADKTGDSAEDAAAAGGDVVPAEKPETPSAENEKAPD